MEEPEIQRKQFIAGAICPECDALDRLVVEYTVASESRPVLSRRRCVACGFQDPFAAEAPAHATGAVPRGKPERRRISEVAATPVTIVEPVGKPTNR